MREAQQPPWQLRIENYEDIRYRYQSIGEHNKYASFSTFEIAIVSLPSEYSQPREGKCYGMVMGPTLRQIAARTGLAISTVSRAINGHPHVDELTRRRVLDVARELGYRPNNAARALRGSGTHTVGVVLPDMMNHFYARTVSVLHD